MTTARTILAIVLLLLAAFIVVMNGICVIVSSRNQKRGIDRHSSMVPLISVIATIVSYLIFPYPKADWMFIIPFLDLSNWSLLWLPFHLLRESNKKPITEQAGRGDGDKPPN
jgi:amino acid transporter